MNFLNLDWLGFTFKGEPYADCTLLEQFYNRFPEFDPAEFVHAPFHTSYNTAFLFFDIVIAYNDLHKKEYTESEISHLFAMGVNVQVPSHCLSFLCEMFGIDCESPSAPYDLFALISSRGCSFSRIDLCFDDYKKDITTKFYIDAWSKGCIQSPYIRSITCMGSDQTGYTMYFGSLKNRRKLLRIYDKFLESKDKENFKDCVRYEFELHSDDAQSLADFVLDHFCEGIPFSDFLYKWVRVKDFDSVQRNSILQHAKDDSAWIQALSLNLTLKYPIRIVKNSNPVGELTRFVEHMAIPSLAGYVTCFGEKALFKLIEDAARHGKIKDSYVNFARKLKYCEGFSPTLTAPFFYKEDSFV